MATAMSSVRFYTIIQNAITTFFASCTGILWAHIVPIYVYYQRERWRCVCVSVCASTLELLVESREWYFQGSTPSPPSGSRTPKHLEPLARTGVGGGSKEGRSLRLRRKWHDNTMDNFIPCSFTSHRPAYNLWIIEHKKLRISWFSCLNNWLSCWEVLVENISKLSIRCKCSSYI